MSPPPENLPDPHAHKLRTGLNRLWHATGHSLAGLRAGLTEKAFQLELMFALILLPATWAIARNWIEAALLAGSVLIVLIVELLNSAIEAVVDRAGPEWHGLSKRAKDLGSAAVMLSVLLCGGTWLAALWQRFGP